MTDDRLMARARQAGQKLRADQDRLAFLERENARLEGENAALKLMLPSGPYTHCKSHEHHGSYCAYRYPLHPSKWCGYCQSSDHADHAF